MKKLVTAILTAALAVTSTSVAFAAGGTGYEAAKLKNPVTVDGKIDGAEWDDANEIVMNADQKDITWANDVKYTADEFSVSMKFKWDENNLYILQQRKDVDFKESADALAPFNADGTLIFLTNNAKNTGRYDIFFTAEKPATAVRAYSEAGAALAAAATDCKIATTKEGDVHTTEIIIPWSEINSKVIDKYDVKEGSEFTFCVIMPNTNAKFGQMHYNVEAGKGADDPTAWASFKLAAAKAGGNTNNESSTTTPPTGDNFGAIIAAGVIGAVALTAGVLAVSKKKSK